ncbi:MAG: glycosyltransferase family A protein [Pseudomonadota bacterium]
MMSYEIAVIIPHYNDPERLARCLTALIPQADEDVEIVVADNASTVDLSPVRDAFPTVRFVTEPTSGAGPARNRGVAETTAPWLMFIDADCLPASDWLAVGRRIAKDGTVIGGRVDVFHETPRPCSGAEAFEQVFAFKMAAYLTRDAFLGAGNLVVSRAVFEDVGGFRPAVSEDKEWSQRAAKAGHTLAFEHEFAAGHPSRQDWAALRHKWRRLTREGFLLEGHSGRMKWALRALLMPASVLAHLPKVLRAPGLTVLEKRRAVGTLVRIRLARMGWMLGQALRGAD